MIQKDLVIIGAGAAGLSSALAAYQNGIEDILILEKEEDAGGILNQCIHNGFGLGYFGEDLTGIEYAARIETLFKTCISAAHNTGCRCAYLSVAALAVCHRRG